MKLGEKLGAGAGSEVYAFGEGRVIKLFASGTPRALVEYEARVTAAAFACGAPAPEIFGTETICGRAGIILTRYDGSPLLELIVRGEVSPADAGAILARIHAELHAPQYRAELWSFREFVEFMCGRLPERGVPPDVIQRAQKIAAELPARGVLCHSDLHLANVLMTSRGPAIVDWISAMNASPLVDVARQHLTLAVLPLPATYAAMRAAAEASFMRTYAGLTGTNEEELRTAIAPYVTVMAAMRLNEGACDESEREMLVEFIRSR